MKNKPILCLNYSKEGIAIADSKCEEYLLDLYEIYKDSDKEIELSFSTYNIITCLRALINDGKIPHTWVLISYENDDVKSLVDKHGSLQHYPEGFNDYSVNWLMRLIN